MKDRNDQKNIDGFRTPETLAQTIARLNQVRHDAVTGGMNEAALFEVLRNLDIALATLRAMTTEGYR